MRRITGIAVGLLCLGAAVTATARGRGDRAASQDGRRFGDRALIGPAAHSATLPDTSWEYTGPQVRVWSWQAYSPNPPGSNCPPKPDYGETHGWGYRWGGKWDPSMPRD